MKLNTMTILQKLKLWMERDVYVYMSLFTYLKYILQHFTEFLGKRSLSYHNTFVKQKKRGTYLTLEGCVAFLKCFKYPNDGLIWEIEKKIAGYSLVQEKKDPAEQFVDNELSRIETEAKVKNLLKDVENIREKVNKVKELSFRDIIKQLLKEIIVEEFNKEEKIKMKDLDFTLRERVLIKLLTFLISFIGRKQDGFYSCNLDSCIHEIFFPKLEDK